MNDFTPFLRQVVRRYFADGRIEDCCFIFPNRRSMVFFRKWLAEEVRLAADRPLIMPRMFTQNDFFCEVGGMRVADRITLLLELYDCYRELNSMAEPLDDFIFWGDVLLGDFNDVDKYLVDPHRLFANVSDLKAIRDSFSYLTEKQREAMEKFIAHFDRIAEEPAPIVAHGQDSGSGKRDVKRDFLQIWNILEPLYDSFNSRLREKGLAYEGMIYRAVAERTRTESVADVLSEAFGGGPGPEGLPTFVFVGLNALNECEKLLMRKMRDASLAEFCWDYSGRMITDPQNKSSFFMAENVREFPQAFEWEEVGDHVPNVKIVRVPSWVGQTKVVEDIVKNREDCAVVMPDEELLMPLLNSIPPEVDAVNVTMGRSLRTSVFYALVCAAADLQLHARRRGEEWSFYHKAVREVFTNGVFVKAAGPECRERMRRIVDEGKIYVPEEDFRGEGLSLLETTFRTVVKKPAEADAGQIRELAQYLMDVVTAAVDGNRAACGTDDLTLGFAKTLYCEISRLADKNLCVLPKTWTRLLKRVCEQVSVPLRGEPLLGLQIMGPLEMRALDFSNLVILSANEGVFPRRSVSSSFIPPELRRSFDLPTYEYQDAVWAYYFYRMIARAENVWMIYDTSSTGMKSGEASRYIKQLKMHFHVRMTEESSTAPFGANVVSETIVKTDEDVEKIKDICFSASTLKNYLDCPAMFYYGKVLGLKTEDEISESLDSRTVGNVYHALMQSLYTGSKAMSPDFRFEEHKEELREREKSGWVITADYLRSWKERKADIKKKVSRLVCDELHVPEVSGRDLVTADVIVRYALQTIGRDLELLESCRKDKFLVLGLEMGVSTTFEGFKLYGKIDRLDSVEPGRIRVCDYKTGKVKEKDVKINDDNAHDIAWTVFDSQDNDKRPLIALQVFIYDLLLKETGRGEKIGNVIYQTSGLFSDPVTEYPLSDLFYDDMRNGLKRLLADIADVNVPFRRTENAKTCEWCKFKIICGK